MLLSPNLYGIGPLIGWGIQNFVVAQFSKKYNTIKIGLLLHSVCFIMTLFLYPLFGLDTLRLPYIVLSALSGAFMVFGFICYTNSLKKGAVSIIAPVINAKSIVTAILSFIFLKESMYFSKIIGIIIILVGVFLLAIDLNQILKKTKVSLYSGVGWAIVGALFWGVGIFFTAVTCISLHWYTANLGLRLFMTLTLLILLPFFKVNIKTTPPRLDTKIIIASFFDFLGCITFNIGLSKGDPSVITAISGASVLVTITLSVIFLKEKINIIQISGILLTIAGVVLLSLI